ncbi:MAG: MerR family transcriptional regulator [Bacteriovorax sp.]|nr:MerR family transcriptional regulator [Bacteriovorax sp.]
MASKISGVGVHTIRAWEKRYKALEPLRDSSGHRTYTKTDVEKLMLLSELCLLGYTISKVAKYEIPELKLLLKDLGKDEVLSDSSEFNLIKEKPTADASGSTNILLFALKAYKLDVINQEIGKLKELVSGRDMVLDIINPLLKELNALKTRGEFSVIQEETVINLLRFHTGLGLYRHIEKRDRGTTNIVIANFLEGSNDLELIMAGLLCNHYGFNFTYLGPNISVEALSDSVKFLNTNLIILGTLSNTGTHSHGIGHIQSYIEKLMLKSAPDIEVLLSGNGELNLDKIPAKRFKCTKTILDLDQYLSKKLN